MSKAPKASDALRELRSRMHERGGMLRRDIRDLIGAQITAAERAEAEAAEGESVEGRLARLVDAICMVDAEADVRGYHITGGLRSALAEFNDSLTTPDASWLDGASFEEMEKWLPQTCAIHGFERHDGFYVRNYGATDGAVAPTRTEAVRAFLAAHPELWEGKR